eukprot:TRINITY_DN13992_c0_g1_i2.p1 TRINITY_DN13992_c0_g1~~TRINITY_DN13992_c0_g1_i2.p1  ORF type:complete len:272 (+),score=72.31 TRINITY_DN13992_c0_g1_i2:114-929(+)
MISQSATSEAVVLLRDTQESLRQVVGPQHPLSLVALQNLSLALAELTPGSEEAIALGREAAEGKLLVLGENNAETFEAWRDLAIVLNSADRREEAERTWRQALQGQERLLGFAHPVTQQTLRQLREALERWGDAAGAAELRKEYDAGKAVQAERLPPAVRPGPLVAVVLSVYIVPKHRRRGLGRAALTHWLTAARDSYGATALEAWIPLGSTSSTAEGATPDANDDVEAAAGASASAVAGRFLARVGGMARVAERAVAGSGVKLSHLHREL